MKKIHIVWYEQAGICQYTEDFRERIVVQYTSLINKNERLKELYLAIIRPILQAGGNKYYTPYAGLLWDQWIIYWLSYDLSTLFMRCLPQCWNPSTPLIQECPAVKNLHKIMKDGFYCINEIAL